MRNTEYAKDNELTHDWPHAVGTLMLVHGKPDTLVHNDSDSGITRDNTCSSLENRAVDKDGHLCAKELCQ